MKKKLNTPLTSPITQTRIYTRWVPPSLADHAYDYMDVTGSQDASAMGQGWGCRRRTQQFVHWFTAYASRGNARRAA